MVAVSRAGVRLALVAALQYLSARQRALLILRDVLEWPAAQATGAAGAVRRGHRERRRRRAGRAVGRGCGAGDPCRRGRARASPPPGGPPLAPLSRELELLDAAVSYALAGAGMATPRLLSRPTPLRAGAGPGRAPARPGSQAAGRLRRRRPGRAPGRRGDRELTASMVAVTGAIEITVHALGHLGRVRHPPAGPAGPGGRPAARHRPRCSSPRPGARRGLFGASTRAIRAPGGGWSS